MEVGDAWFWDLKYTQYVVHKETGETLCIYGPDEVVKGGPFSVEVFEGATVLIAREGLDEEKALHFLAEVWSITFSEASVVDMPEGAEVQRTARLANGEEMAEDAARKRKDDVALTLQTECGRFRSEFYWRMIGIPAGRRSWRLWVSIPWVVHFLFGSNGASRQRIWAIAKRWGKFLEGEGWDASHIRDSGLATSRKRKRDEEEGGQGLQRPASDEWTITIPALLKVLLKISSTPRWQGKQCGDAGGQAVALRARGLCASLIAEFLKGRGLEVDVGQGVRLVVCTDGKVAWQSHAGSAAKRNKFLSLSACLVCVCACV